LQASFQTIEDDFGTLEDYLGVRLGLTAPKLERLRQMYLE
jgi:hypothetical protein